jgi:hypothetical protein
VAYNDDAIKWAQERAINGARANAETDLVQAHRVYEDSVRAGDDQTAAEALRQLTFFKAQLDSLGGSVEPSPYTAKEQQILAQRPSITNNPQKLAELHRVGAALTSAGIPRDSPAFF